ncbi:MAG TPA: NUDIX domain-containing protein [Polyangiaceae bacterium]|nr:NUDIX domain-containing protein [Polyangiaceae bacterium]
MPLPPLPKVEFVEVEDLSPEEGGGFLRLRRRRLTVRRPDGSESAPFLYDSVDRRALDAVVVAAHYLDGDGRRCVYLRSALRPPAALRPPECRPIPEKEALGSLWELPAGLVEADECNADGLMRCAARELEEELGFDVAPPRLLGLGFATFPSAGVVGERHHFFHVEVAPDRRHQPSEDGSPLEADAIVVALPLDEALDLVRGGAIEDGKTEIGLRRLAEI